ncbi:peptidase M20 [Pyrenophora tritici-repentis]|nr:peptidase M20 [Pyrenophora tritici-repentis]
MKDMDADDPRGRPRPDADRAQAPARRGARLLADEEAGGTYGARYLVDRHPGCSRGSPRAISEVGGFSFTVNENLRLYLVETAQKGMHWMRLTVEGTAGHGSMTNTDNAITELCEAVGRLGRHQFPVRVTKTDMEATLAKLGGIAKIIGATLRNTAAPTMLGAGYKVNVIPGQATAARRRPVPARVRGGVPRRPRPDPRAAGQARGRARGQGAGDRVRRGPRPGDADGAAAEDPIARAVPYMLSGGTDAKSFDDLGIRGFGFAPLKLPPELDFAGMFHGWTSASPSMV